LLEVIGMADLPFGEPNEQRRQRLQAVMRV
jgi:hypothetical protein